jgi:hypothetical protein
VQRLAAGRRQLVLLAVASVAVFAQCLRPAGPPRGWTAASTTVGELAGAPYRIDVPAQWNGGLVLYCHGYRAAPVRFDPAVTDETARTFAPLGYAVAQSAYSAGGYALREATNDTERLRRHFATRFGVPTETWISGQSLGGSVTMMSMELYPATYDGGLSMCAPLGPALGYIKTTAFDLLVLFEHWFPGVLPSPAQVPPGYEMTVARAEELERKLDGSSAAADALRRFTTSRTNAELGRTLDLFTYILGELHRRWGGNAFDNQDTIYRGLGDDTSINDGVKRYSADADARAHAVRDYSPTGHIARPLLSLTTVYDPLISSFSSDRYAEIAQTAGRGGLFAQKYVKGAGHCAIRPEEIRAAFIELRQWRRTGVRPSAGALLLPDP